MPLNHRHARRLDTSVSRRWGGGRQEDRGETRHGHAPGRMQARADGRVIDVFDGNGAPAGPNCTLFSGVDLLMEVSRGRSDIG